MTALDAFARIPRALAILARHPDGLPLTELAAEMAIDEAILREEILQYYGTDIPPQELMGLSRPATIEFLAADGEDAEPEQATVVRVASDQPAGELGVEMLRADHLARLYDAAASLSELEPENAVLAEAVEILGEEFLAEAAIAGRARPSGSVERTLRHAVEDRQAVEIQYSRAWHPGVSTRVVHPYALRHTARGWELDAGPLVAGHSRTYLLDHVRRAAPLEETFARPADLDEILRAERVVVPVELSLPQRTQWVVDRFAERTEIRGSDAEDLAVVAHFLPPVADRVGLVLLIAGPDAFVVAPPALEGAAAPLARRLLAHHGL